MRNSLLIGSLLTLFLSGCFIRGRNDGYYGGPPPPTRRIMSYQEAVDRGYGECRERRLDCRLQNAHLARGDSVWKVKMRAFGEQRKGHLFLEYDAFSGNLVDVDAKVRNWRGASAPRWDRDDDWDDEYDGMAKAKVRDHAEDAKDRRNDSDAKDRKNGSDDAKERKEDAADAKEKDRKNAADAKKDPKSKD